MSVLDHLRAHDPVHKGHDGETRDAVFLIPVADRVLARAHWFASAQAFRLLAGQPTIDPLLIIERRRHDHFHDFVGYCRVDRAQVAEVELFISGRHVDSPVLVHPVVTRLQNGMNVAEAPPRLAMKPGHELFADRRHRCPGRVSAVSVVHNQIAEANDRWTRHQTNPQLQAQLPVRGVKLPHEPSGVVLVFRPNLLGAIEVELLFLARDPAIDEPQPLVQFIHDPTVLAPLFASAMLVFQPFQFLLMRARLFESGSPLLPEIAQTGADRRAIEEKNLVHDSRSCELRVIAVDRERDPNMRRELLELHNPRPQDLVALDRHHALALPQIGNSERRGFSFSLGHGPEAQLTAQIFRSIDPRGRAIQKHITNPRGIANHRDAISPRRFVEECGIKCHLAKVCQAVVLFPKQDVISFLYFSKACWRSFRTIQKKRRVRL
ncbi:MAG: hypothetical protein AAB408_01860 [Patescibacteria group bacterium]